jgi:hypothetical protein
VIDSYRTYQAIDIASETETVPKNKVDEKITEYKQNDYTYMALLQEREYYNVDEDQYGDIKEEQFISGGLDILETLRKLKENPFLLIDNESATHIVTVSDLNDRKIKEMAYPVIGEMEELLAEHIKQLFSPEDLLEMGEVNDKAKERWKDAKNRDVNLHPVEYLSSHGMEKIVRNSKQLRQKTGLDKYDNPGDKIDQASEVRHKIAHGNRSLIYNKDRIEKVERRLEHAQDINQTLR